MTWRFLHTPPMDGPGNMALDEALLLSFLETGVPVFRVYGWKPSALSLGKSQDPRRVLDLERCRAEDVTVVRRITGGGVIYHTDEITYSLACAPGSLPSTSVKESYRFLTAFLLRFYRDLGLPASYAAEAPGTERLGERTAFCFAGKEDFDILVSGRKIGGNAQRRTKGAVFQHGSIPLIDRSGTGLGYMTDRSGFTPGAATSLFGEGITDSASTLAERLAEAFAATTGVLTPSSLTDREEELLAALREKHESDRWVVEGR